MPRIFDAVYDYIELEDVEFDLVTSPIFQRLHSIKQLGPLHTVFPSAQHSRFSHTIGVFYIIKKMISHLEKRFETDEYGYQFERGDKEILKFAALLHDIGHVPLSHIGEEVLKETAKEDIIQKLEDGEVDITGKERGWWRLFPEEECESGSTKLRGGSTKLHERLSAEIILHDNEIDKILSKVWGDPRDLEQAKIKIARIIVGTDETDIPTLLLHSELDADRLDYLLRDSFFTGVGYGHIDLDYIISRLAVYREEDGTAHLCIENKGLHTVEHYILGRFFLQTQVIFNRKVRFMDLLFTDVMKYMVKGKCDEDCKLMNLADFRGHIRECKGINKRKHLHEVYAYTDAQVFVKMRRLHEKLDTKETDGTADEEELYINDCIKIIMDGKVSDPIYTCQMREDLVENEEPEKSLQDKANKIAVDVAEELGFCKEGVKRVKVDVVAQEVMKYQKRKTVNDEGKEEANSEAVKIMYEEPGGDKQWKYAAESNATILDGLTDRALVIFNVYYIPLKRVEGDEEIKTKEGIIKKAYGKFIQDHFQLGMKNLAKDEKKVNKNP